MGLGSASDTDIILASVGGLLIGISTTINLGLKGEITGMSGTLNAILRFDTKVLYPKLALLFGMFITSSIFYLAQKEGQFYESVDEFQQGLSIFGFIFAGYFTGLGAKLQNGCTSGHGICGLPRFSIRSYVAVGTFMCSAFATANIKHYAFPDYESEFPQLFKEEGDTIQIIETSTVLGLSVILVILTLILNKLRISDSLVTFLTGVIFAVGLILSGMVKRHIILDFLTFTSNWNPQLIFVLAFGCGFNFISFYLLRNKTTKPLLAEKYCLPTNKTIDLKLISGGILFGIGWAVGGLCPGPIFCLIPTFFSEVLFCFCPALILGLQSEVIYNKAKKYFQKNKVSNSDIDEKENQQNQNMQKQLSKQNSDQKSQVKVDNIEQIIIRKNSQDQISGNEQDQQQRADVEQQQKSGEIPTNNQQ